MNPTPRFSLSLRAVLTTSILGMAVLTMALGFWSGNMHRALAVKHEQRSLAELTTLAVRDEIENLTAAAADMGLKLQHLPAFRKAFADHDRGRLRALLEEQFHQYFVTAGVLPLEQIQVLTATPNMVASAGMKDVPFSACVNRVDHLGTLQGPSRIKVNGGYCREGVHYAVAVPVGGLRLQGYLLIVTDPVPVLSRVRERLGYPLQVVAPNRRVLWHADWPAPNELHNYVVASYPVRRSDDSTVLNLVVAHDAAQFHADLARLDIQVLAIGLAITGLMTLFAGMVLRHTTVMPLHRLIQALQQPHSMGDAPPLPRLMVSELETLKRLCESMHHASCTDPLTGLANRKRFESCLECLHSLGRRNRDPFALLVIDLDGFKGVNDRHGHAGGDGLLRELAERLRTVLRKEANCGRQLHCHRNSSADLIARIGGDEFAVLLPGVTQHADAQAIACKLYKAVKQPFQIGEVHARIGMSIGIALFPHDAQDTETLFHRADQAMYNAKIAGGGVRLARGTAAA